MSDELHPYGFTPVQCKAMRAEVARELDMRRRTYPAMVRKSTLTQDDADRQLAIFAEIGADLVQAFRNLAPSPPDPQGALRFTRAEKIAELKRELELRGRVYPRHVERHELSQYDANARIGALADVLALYQRQLFRWEPPSAEARAYLAAADALSAELGGFPADCTAAAGARFRALPGYAEWRRDVDDAVRGAKALDAEQTELAL